MTREFPTEDMELSILLVVSDFARANNWYQNVLGATLHREYGGNTAVYQFQKVWLIVTIAGETTRDKPSVTFSPPPDPTRVSSELVIRVPDCRHAYETLKERGASFLTPPVDWGPEIRAFFRDPDGHLFEISELTGK